MEKVDRKRSRDETDDQSSSSSPPPYGTREYWEERYTKQQKASHSTNEMEDEPDPFHAWYFNYDELAPLILPIIIGDVDVKENGSVDITADKGSGEQVPPMALGSSGATVETKDSNAVNDDESEKEDEGEDEFEEVEIGDDDDEESRPVREGLARNGPIEILEVGCGDVPLGVDILSGIVEYGDSLKGMQASPARILKRIICVDYSQTLIEELKTRQKASTNNTKMIPLDYECEDARTLPYETGRFQFILEKGTMDAMLSEPDVGPDNCRAIVAEMARLVAVRGVIMVISHVNAHTEDGMEWLNTIVVPGLRKGSISSRWSVEVHGGEVPDVSEAESEDSTSVNPGPAVYIIHKGDAVEGVSSSTEDADLPPVSFLFCSY